MKTSLKPKLYLLSSSSMTFISKATSEIQDFVETQSRVQVQLCIYTSLTDLWKELEHHTEPLDNTKQKMILFQVKPSMDIVSLRNLISSSCSIPTYIVHVEPVSHLHNMKSFEYPHLKYPLYACDNVKKKEISLF